MTDVLSLSSDELADLAAPADYLEAVRAGYRQRGEGAPAAPRTTLRAEHTGGMLTSYLTILPDSGYMGGYTYAAGFETGDAWFVLPLFDADAGELIAILDGAAMNPFKTGAVGAVGTDALAREDAAVLGVIGAGTQARGQILATATVRAFDRVLIFSPTAARREQTAAELDGQLDAMVEPVDSARAVVEQADVLVTATTSGEPVFDGEWVQPGTHITAMGQYDPDRREVDTTTIERATYVPDLRERIHSDAGAFIQARQDGAVTDNHVHGELGEVVAGVVPGRTDPSEITFLDSGGTAIETVAAGGMLYERAVAAGRGTTIEWSPASEAFIGRE